MTQNLETFHRVQASKLRAYNLSVPLQKEWTGASLRRAFLRLRGMLLFTYELRTVQRYGTRSGFLDAAERYKSNLQSVVHSAKKLVCEHILKPKENLRGVIHPDAPWLNWWNVVIFVIMLYSFLIVPFLLAFYDVEAGSPWFYVDIIVDCLFLMDIVITANTAYYSGAHLVTSRKAILCNYIRGMMVIDMVSTFPMYLTALTTGGAGTKSNSLVRFVRITKLTKLARATKIVKVLKFFGSSTAMESLAQSVKKHSGIMRLIWTLNIVAIISHFTACMWYYSAKQSDFSPDTWVVRNNLQDESVFTLYLVSLYWAITTLTTVGFGDIYAVTSVEMLLAMLWMLFGVGFYSFVTGTLSSMITGIDDDTAALEEKLQEVDMFAKDTGLSRKYVKHLVEEVSQVAKGATLTEDESEALMAELSRFLRIAVVRQMHDSAATRIEIFTKVSVFCLLKMLPRMARRRFASKETIYSKGDASAHVFFVLEGRVQFLLSRRRLVLKTIVGGGFFGEREVMLNIEREYTTEAEGDCDILMLRKEVFLEQIGLFPDFGAMVEEIVNVRKARDEEHIAELLDLLEAVEIRKAASYGELAGKSLIKRQRTQPDLFLTDPGVQKVGSETSLLSTLSLIHSKVSVPTMQEIKDILRTLAP